MSKQTKKKYLLLIELTNAASQTFLLNKQGSVVSQGCKEFNPKNDKPAYYEYDPLEILYSLRSSIINVLKNITNTNLIDCIGIVNNSNICLAWEKNSGLPLTPAINNKTSHISNQWKIGANKALSHTIQEKTGLRANSKYLAEKIKWLANHYSSIQNTPKKNIQIGTLESWLLYNLTGKKVFATDFTNAAKTMLFNINKLDWDPELLKEFSIITDSLPTPKPSSHLFGHTNGFVPLPDSIPITCVIHKNQACLYSSNGIHFTDNHLIYNESSIIINTGQELLNPFDETNNTIISTSQNTRFAIEIPVQLPLQTLNILSGSNPNIAEPETQKALKNLKNADSIYVHAYKETHNTTDPYKNMILGITSKTTPLEIYKAILESIAFQIKFALEKLEQHTGIVLKELHTSGNYINNDFLMELQANILQIPITFLKQDTKSILGAAYITGQQTEFYKKPFNQNKKNLETYLPSLDPISSYALYNQWLSMNPSSDIKI
jgi:glycerol kinase